MPLGLSPLFPRWKGLSRLPAAPFPAADDLRRRLEEAEAERDASRGDVDRLEAVLEQVQPRGAPLALPLRLCGQICQE